MANRERPRAYDARVERGAEERLWDDDVDSVDWQEHDQDFGRPPYGIPRRGGFGYRARDDEALAVERRRYPRRPTRREDYGPGYERYGHRAEGPDDYDLNLARRSFGSQGARRWNYGPGNSGFGIDRERADVADYAGDAERYWADDEAVWVAPQPAAQPGPMTGRGPRGYARSGERIREEVCDRLERHGRVDATDIEVSVQNAEVILEGTVRDRRQKRMAEGTAESVAGVQDVHNHLRISRGDASGK